MDATRFLAGVYRAQITLGGAIGQMIETDDKIICGRVREAHETLRTVMEIARQEAPEAAREAEKIALQEIGR